jgi:hypothetical protein
MLKVSIWASIAVEALACSERLLPVLHPAIAAKIKALAAMAANVVVRISFSPSSGVNLRWESYRA